VAKASVRWIGNKEFVGTDSSKHSVVMSTQDEASGTGMRPSELLLVALAGCTAVDVVSILEKRREKLTGLEVTVDGEQDEDPPWTYRKIHLTYTLHGIDLSQESVQRAIRISEDKYCSVRATVSGVADVTSSYKIVTEEH
jgi:putative redox protein